MRRWLKSEWSIAEARNLLSQVCVHYGTAVVLDDNNNNGWTKNFLAAFGVIREVKLQSTDGPEMLSEFIRGANDYVFGHCAYNLKEATEGIACDFPDTDGFSAAHFFIPQIVVAARASEVYIGYIDEDALAQFTARCTADPVQQRAETAGTWIHRTDRDRYLAQAASILKRIHRGDIYEINYCVEFYQEQQAIDPVATYHALQVRTQAPFGGLYRSNDAWLMCGSPELYLRKTGDKLVSQPIKGTRRRGATPEEDLSLRNELQQDQKERSENVMIVDLVRNDLSRVAARGSVHVSDLFGITSFKTVHQMSSTIECTLRSDVQFADILQATFPMGSMTGAPKISAMRIAEEHEDQSRGLYSGTIGYITPEGDFEFNVVIRSILWNSATGYLSTKAGSALTVRCIAEQEYEECLLKAQAMMGAIR